MQLPVNGHPEDLAVIDAYMRAAAARAVADAIRAQTGQLETTGRYLPDTHNELALPWHQPEPLNSPEPPRERVLHATVRPVAGEPLYERPSWLVRHWPEVAGGLVVAAAVGIGVWLLLLAIAAAFAALTAALTALVPILAIGALVLVAIALCSRGGSGKTFSGTFQGKVH
jgi:hypothetical protein